MKKVLFIIVVTILLIIVAILIFDKPTVKYKPNVDPPIVADTVKNTSNSEKIKNEEITKTKPLPTNILPPQPSIPKTTETEKAVTAPSFPNTFINSDKVRLRKAPNLESEIINTLEIGSIVTVIRNNVPGTVVPDYKNKGWSEVKYVFQSGYIYSAFISSWPSDKLLIKPPFAQLNKDVFLRKGPSNTYDPILELPEKTKVIIVGRTKDRIIIYKQGFDYWFKVDHGKGEGWVYGTYVNLDISAKRSIKVL